MLWFLLHSHQDSTTDSRSCRQGCQKQTSTWLSDHSTEGKCRQLPLPTPLRTIPAGRRQAWLGPRSCACFPGLTLWQPPPLRLLCPHNFTCGLQVPTQGIRASGAQTHCSRSWVPEKPVHAAGSKKRTSCTGCCLQESSHLAAKSTKRSFSEADEQRYFGFGAGERAYSHGTGFLGRRDRAWQGSFHNNKEKIRGEK